MIQLDVRLFGAPRSLQDDVPLAISRRLARTLLRLAAGCEVAARGCLCLRFGGDGPQEQTLWHLARLLSQLRNSLPKPRILQTTAPALPAMALLGRRDEMAPAVEHIGSGLSSGP